MSESILAQAKDFVKIANLQNEISQLRDKSMDIQGVEHPIYSSGECKMIVTLWNGKRIKFSLEEWEKE